MNMAVSNLQNLVDLALSVARLLDSVVHGFSFSQIADFISIVRLAGPSISHAPAALAEYVAMTDAEAVALEEHVVKTFDVEDAVVELVIVNGLKVLIELHGLLALLVKKV